MTATTSAMLLDGMISSAIRVYSDALESENHAEPATHLSVPFSRAEPSVQTVTGLRIAGNRGSGVGGVGRGGEGVVAAVGVNHFIAVEDTLTNGGLCE